MSDSEIFTPTLRFQRYMSMLDFIARHRIESRLGNLNPDPIVPIISSQAIPRHIESSTEEYDIYKLLLPTDRIIPISSKDKK